MTLAENRVLVLAFGVHRFRSSVLPRDAFCFASVVASPGWITESHRSQLRATRVKRHSIAFSRSRARWRISSAQLLAGRTFDC